MMQVPECCYYCDLTQTCKEAGLKRGCITGNFVPRRYAVAVVDTLPYMDRRMREIEMARQATPPTGPNRHEVGQERPTHPLTDLTGF